MSPSRLDTQRRHPSLSGPRSLLAALVALVGARLCPHGRGAGCERGQLGPCPRGRLSGSEHLELGGPVLRLRHPELCIAGANHQHPGIDFVGRCPLDLFGLGCAPHGGRSRLMGQTGRDMGTHGRRLLQRARHGLCHVLHGDGRLQRYPVHRRGNRHHAIGALCRHELGARGVPSRPRGQHRSQHLHRSTNGNVLSPLERRRELGRQPLGDLVRPTRRPTCSRCRTMPPRSS